ncbi:DUF5625 family protein [Aliarcobacter butzleri]|uniref:DUF5625 family protein n=1 Tax=Aliarcobacter butzleri TaxID=28197 RepID=UPI00125F0C87|nr:DUF5625 family protein [Aliarcobacter butzleri]MCG3658000.1 hypothetical protein [Aliarcobacter butzleri]MDN5068452.1 hypothetical protein [Aliarcobacter butzleri]
MKTYIKIFFLPLLIVFIFNGCVRVAYGLVNHFTEENVALEEINLEKTGVIADFDIDISEPEYYDFIIDFIYNKDELRKEIVEFEQKNPKSKLYIERLESLRDIVGNKYENKKGIKIVLKLTVTPLSLDKSENIFSLGSRYTEEKAKDLEVSKAIEYTMDFSERDEEGGRPHCFNFDSKESKWEIDNKKCTYSSSKKTVYSKMLSKGKYHIKLENLEDVPEIKKIDATLFRVYFFRQNFYK